MAEITTPYINLQTDFGFKHAFGNLQNKQALIRFLNILFEGKLTVTDVNYHDKEMLPSEQEGKRIVYDVYCTSCVKRSDSSYFPTHQLSNGKDNLGIEHHFVLEMQNIYTPPFEERIVFYASKMVAAQGKAGWNYEIEPVFAVAVIDFNLSHMSEKLIRDVMLVDRESMEPLTDKLHILLCSLKQVTAKWEDCRTELERILFLIKNMDKMDNTSLAYREGRFPEIFEAARSNRLRDDEKIAYSDSLEKLRDTQAGIVFAANNAREEGREEGRASEKIEIAQKMLLSNLSPEMISSFTGLSLAEIKQINPES